MKYMKLLSRLIPIFALISFSFASVHGAQPQKTLTITNRYSEPIYINLAKDPEPSKTGTVDYVVGKPMSPYNALRIEPGDSRIYIISDRFSVKSIGWHNKSWYSGWNYIPDVTESQINNFAQDYPNQPLIVKEAAKGYTHTEPGIQGFEFKIELDLTAAKQAAARAATLVPKPTAYAPTAMPSPAATSAFPAATAVPSFAPSTTPMPAPTPAPSAAIATTPTPAAATPLPVLGESIFASAVTDIEGKRNNIGCLIISPQQSSQLTDPFYAIAYNKQLYSTLGMSNDLIANGIEIKWIGPDNSPQNINTFLAEHIPTHEKIVIITEGDSFKALIETLKTINQKNIIHSIIAFNPTCSSSSNKFPERNSQPVIPNLSFYQEEAETPVQTGQTDVTSQKSPQGLMSWIASAAQQAASLPIGIITQAPVCAINLYSKTKECTMGYSVPLDIPYEAIEGRIYNFYSKALWGNYYKIIPASEDINPSEATMFPGVNIRCYDIGHNSSVKNSDLSDKGLREFPKLAEKIEATIAKINNIYHLNTDLICILSKHVNKADIIQDQPAQELYIPRNTGNYHDMTGIPFIFVNRLATTQQTETGSFISYHIASRPYPGSWDYYWKTVNSISDDSVHTRLQAEAIADTQNRQAVPYVKSIIGTIKSYTLADLIAIVNNLQAQDPTNSSLSPAITNPEKQEVSSKLDLSPEEKKAIEDRSTIVRTTIEKLLGMEAVGAHLPKIPTIAVVASGGGIRAMLTTFGVLLGLQRANLMNTVMYMVGLSGSTWAIGQWLMSPQDPSALLVSAVDESSLAVPIQRTINALASASAGNLIWGTTRNIPQYVGLINRAGKENKFLTPHKFYFGKPTSLIDIWANAVFRNTLNYPAETYRTLSTQSSAVSRQNFPIPIYTAVTPNCKHSKHLGNLNWVEFSPYQIGWNNDTNKGTYVSTQHFGRSFYSGRPIDYMPEENIKNLMGVWGSALCFNLDEQGPKTLFQFSPKGLTEVRISLAQYPNPAFQMPDNYNRDEEFVGLVDAGLAFNLPYPPISGDRPERKADIIIFVDASAGGSITDQSTGNQTIPKGSALQKTELYAKEHGHSFPNISSLDPLNNSMQVFGLDTNDPNVPIVIYMPITKIPAELTDIHATTVFADTNPSSGEYANAQQFLEGLKKQNFQGSLMGGDYGTNNTYYPKNVSAHLIALMEFNTLNNQSKIVNSIRHWVAKITQSPIADQGIQAHKRIIEQELNNIKQEASRLANALPNPIRTDIINAQEQLKAIDNSSLQDAGKNIDSLYRKIDRINEGMGRPKFVRPIATSAPAAAQTQPVTAAAYPMSPTPAPAPVPTSPLPAATAYPTGYQMPSTALPTPTTTPQPTKRLSPAEAAAQATVLQNWMKQRQSQNR